MDEEKKLIEADRLLGAIAWLGYMLAVVVLVVYVMMTVVFN